MCGLLIAAFPCGRAWAPWYTGFSSWDAGLSRRGRPALEHRLLAVVQGLRCSAACGILPDQEADPCLQHGQAGSLPLSYQEALAGVSLRRVPGKPAGFSSPAQLPGCAVDQGLTGGLQ